MTEPTTEPTALDTLKAQLAEAQQQVLGLTSQLSEAQALQRRETELHAQTKGELDHVRQQLGEVSTRFIGAEIALRDQASLIRSLEARIAGLVAWRANARAALNAPIETVDKPEGKPK